MNSLKKVRDDDHKLTAKCMRVMTSALDVGADIDRLVKATGYSRDFIEAISQRMRAAGLWIGEMIDEMGWLDESEDLTLEFYLQSQVAIGRVLREQTTDGRYRYIDAESREPLTARSGHDESAMARTVIRSMLG
jgi:hypothetical protein